jgi:hypothetical protein
MRILKAIEWFVVFLLGFALFVACFYPSAIK